MSPPAISSTVQARRRRINGERGSLLLVALLFAAAITLVLASYLQLGRTSMQVAHRAFFINDAINLAEAGLEDAVYSFKQMTAGSAAAAAWTGWTLSGTTASKTLTPFNRDQNAVGVVKVYVDGYDGSNAAPTVHAQAVITPFDRSAPVVKTVRATLRKNPGKTTHGLVALNGIAFKGKSYADSFNSNPTGSPTGPWRSYSASIAQSNASVAVLAGALTVASGKIYGNLFLGPGVLTPPSSDYEGTVTTNYQASFTMPAFPTASGVTRSYDVGSSIPTTLPVSGHLPASDGRYYYFCKNTTIGTVSIASGKNVTIVGSNTDMGPGMSIAAGSSCMVYMDGVVTLSRGADLNNSSWAGALQIFTTTSGECRIGNDSQIVACLFAPKATLTATGRAASSMMVGYYVANTITVSNNMDFHFDEALLTLTANTSASWAVSGWYELRSAADRATVAARTNNFLR